MMENMEHLEAEEVKTLGEYLQIFQRRKKQFLIPVIILSLLALIIAFVLPAVYRSTATVLIEQQEIPQDLVRSTISTYADQRLEVMQQKVMTTSNLMKIIEKFDLYHDDLQKKTREEVIEAMREDIGMEPLSADVVDPRTGRPTTATIAFSLYFDHPSPEIAQKVANELVSLYLNENLKTRNANAKEASLFLLEESKRLGDKISKLEAKLAKFKQGNMEKLPELVQFNIQLMEKTESEKLDIDRQMQAAKERKIYLEAQLAQLQPNATLYSSSGERILGKESRLKTLQAELVTMSAQYSDDHPDVVKTKKEIKALEKELGVSASKSELLLQLKKLKNDYLIAREKYSAAHPDVLKLKREIEKLEAEIKQTPDDVLEAAPVSKPDNPAYIQLQAQLEAARADLKSFAKRRKATQKRIREYEDRITSAPRVEQDYRALTRDYENTIKKYQEVKDKLMEARLSEELEKERKGERFTLIEPPLLPEVPNSPNRIMIIILGLILSFGVGLVVVALLESMDDSVRGVKSMESLFGSAPLATIPYIPSADEIAETQSHAPKIKLILGGVGLLVVVLILVNYFYKPLDVLWYVILRKLGI
ncbi:MAG TPA: lipopolysaccharide biosynthesis protein [Gammaproteobacteria bacterium]|nr:lipopolysaccharide biosynthesis protein [Gammaproteobacteria bacterium]